MENSRKLFIKAFLEAENASISNLKSEDEIEWEFSEKFESSMNKLIKKNAHIKISTRKKLRRGLFAAIVAAIIAFTGILSTYATNEAAVKIVKKHHKQYVDISLSENSIPPVKTIEKEYALRDVPAGYTTDTYDHNELIILTVWKNGNGGELAFSQETLEASISFDNEHNYQELEINGFDAFYSESPSGACLLWTDGEYWFSINGSGDLIEYVKSGPDHIIEKN